jgi:predicted  nucleic acid-binding Zn-ribbon protein
MPPAPTINPTPLRRGFSIGESMPKELEETRRQIERVRQKLEDLRPHFRRFKIRARVREHEVSELLEKINDLVEYGPAW